MVLCLMPLLTSAQMGEKNFIDQNYIEVTGKAEMEIIPDEIYIRVLIDEADNKNKTALEDRERQMMKSLEKLGIDIKKDVLIKDMTSNFKDYLLRKNDILRAKEYQVLVRDGKTAAEVFMELEKIGISNVNIERLESSEMEKYRREVKIEAVKQAREKAADLAMAIYQDIGRAIYIQEIDFGFRRPMMANSAMEMKSADAKSYDIDFEKIHIEYSILCRFELK